MTQKIPFLSQEKLKLILTYDAETGVFVWKHRTDVPERWNTRYAGKEAGYIWPVGNVAYRVIRIFNWPFLAHRLAVLYVKGRWPKNIVDHADQDGTNNRWINLRETDRSGNGLNRGPSRNSQTGIKGVSPYNGKFRAVICIKGDWRQIGCFDTEEEAEAAYRQHVQSLNSPFAREL